jgi:hypothetical protein
MTLFVLFPPTRISWGDPFPLDSAEIHTLDVTNPLWVVTDVVPMPIDPMPARFWEL